ncbi:MAG: hypothetical protein KAS04_05315, partial [Candidatus Aenigmarchaeota archaeon]|nr:hypothetical protein [Candidatus Aenigmarchaeota archaeon]
MKTKEKRVFIDLEKRVFDVKNETMTRGAWWWWFWLFFFNNPKNPDKPRQLMILWSTKNVKEIKCNHLKIKLDHDITNKTNLDGAVAAWYFDGEKMHHNFLLEQCNVLLKEHGLLSKSKISTSFTMKGKKSIVKIGKDMEFVATAEEKYDMTKPYHNSNTYIRNLGYSIIKVNHLDLKGKVDNKPINGSAYFQRVFVNSPSVPWYWGIIHFESGALLTYTNFKMFAKNFKKDI